MRRARLIRLTVLVILTGSLLGLVARILSTTPRPGGGAAGRSGPQRFGIPRRADGSPFLRGKSVSLSDVLARAGFPIYRPNAPMASDAQLRKVWWEKVEPNLSHVALEYSSGIEIVLRPVGYRDPRRHYLTVVRQLGPPASVKTVLGEPALVMPQKSAVDATHSNRGVVAVVIDGVEIEIYCYIDTDRLMEVAKSLTRNRP